MKRELSCTCGCERDEVTAACGVCQPPLGQLFPGEPEEIARAGSGRFRHDLDQVRNVRAGSCELCICRFLAPFVKGDCGWNLLSWVCLLCSLIGWLLVQVSKPKELAACPHLLDLLVCLRGDDPLLKVGWKRPSLPAALARSAPLSGASPPRRL